MRTLQIGDGLKAFIYDGDHLIYESSGEREKIPIPDNCTDMFVTVGAPTTRLATKRQAEYLSEVYKR